MWHVSSCSGVATLRTAIHLLLTCIRQVDRKQRLRRAMTTMMMRPETVSAGVCDVMIDVRRCMTSPNDGRPRRRVDASTLSLALRATF